MVIQSAVREVCSDLRYQIAVMVIKEGETAPSANPSRKRTAANPAKFWGAARHMQMIPQMNLFLSVLNLWLVSMEYWTDYVHCCTHEFVDMQPRHEIDKGILGDQLADVKDGAAP